MKNEKVKKSIIEFMRRASLSLSLMTIKSERKEKEKKRGSFMKAFKIYQKRLKPLTRETSNSFVKKFLKMKFHGG